MFLLTNLDLHHGLLGTKFVNVCFLALFAIGLLGPILQGGVPGKSCTSGGEANWYERSLKWDEEKSIRQSRS
jgi:hypothetical protein